MVNLRASPYDCGNAQHGVERLWYRLSGARKYQRPTLHPDIGYVFLILSLLILGLGTFSRWFLYGPAERPYYPSFLCAGMFFYAVDLSKGIGFMLLLIVVLILLFGGLGGWGGYRWGGSPEHGYGVGLGTVLVILVVAWLLGAFR